MTQHDPGVTSVTLLMCGEETEVNKVGSRDAGQRQLSVIQVRKNGGQEQAGSSGGVRNCQILAYIWKDSHLELLNGLDEESRQGNREESKITAEFGLRWGRPWEECFGRKEHEFGFGRAGFQAGNRPPGGNGR